MTKETVLKIIKFTSDLFVLVSGALIAALMIVIALSSSDFSLYETLITCGLAMVICYISSIAASLPHQK